MSKPHILTYIDAIKEAEKRSEADDIPVYLIPIQAYWLTESIDEAAKYDTSQVVRVCRKQHTAGVR